MKNEIERKTTSLILMTIMVAGGLTIAIPSMEPIHAQSTPNLRVSAVSEKFENTFGGLQVVEVIVTDPQLMDSDDGQPRVTVDGTKLDMRQARDGNWYGYFKAQDWPGTGPGRAELVRQHGDIRTNINNPSVPEGVNPNDDELGFVRHIDAIEDGETFDIIYHKGATPQSVSIKYDDSTNNGIELDRNSYPRSANVYLTITDHVLNIDPTDNDVWQFTVDGDHALSYRGSGDAGPFTATADALGCEDDCLLRMTDSAILDITNNNILTFEETSANSGVFELRDNDGDGTIMTNAQAPRATNTEITYDDTDVSVNLQLNTATIDLDISGGIWRAGEKIALEIVDADQNRDVDVDEDQTVNNPNAIIPTFITGDPHTLLTEQYLENSENTDDGIIPIYVYTVPTDRNRIYGTDASNANTHQLNYRVDDSHRGIISLIDGGNYGNNRDANTQEVTFTSSANARPLLAIPLGTLGELRDSINGDQLDDRGDFTGRNLFNYDFSVFMENTTRADLVLLDDDRRAIFGGILMDNTPVLPGYDLGSDIRDITGWHVGPPAGNFYRAPSDQSFSLPVQELPNTVTDETNVLLVLTFQSDFVLENGREYPIAADFFSYGFYDDGAQAAERVANQIIRVEVEETSDNTSTFTGTLEYIMVNQLDLAVTDSLVMTGTGPSLTLPKTDYIFDSITPIGNEVQFIAFEGLTDSDARVNYADIDANDRPTTVSAQQDITTSTGVVSLNSDRYSVGSNVVVTLTDADLNTDSGSRQTYNVVPGQTNAGDIDRDQVGIDVDIGELDEILPGDRSLGMLLEVTIDGERWRWHACTVETLNQRNAADGNANNNDDYNVDAALRNDAPNGLGSTGFTLQETGPNTGVFTGSFVVPDRICNVNPPDNPNANTVDTDPTVPTSGKDIGVTYLDFRDASGQIVTVGDSASITASTGSVSLDRTVYPVPFGSGDTAVDGASQFLNKNTPATPIAVGNLKVYVQVNDPDYNLSPAGEDRIEDEPGNGPVMVSISRSGTTCEIVYAGGTTTEVDDQITELRQVRDDALEAHEADQNNNRLRNAYLLADLALQAARDTGNTCPAPDDRNYALIETSPESGIFETSFELSHIDGPRSTDCPSDGNCILQGDIITVQYTDPADASGNIRTVTDSATFDLRNGALQTDKSVYVIGSDMIVTLIDPDLDLDSDAQETYPLNIIEWDSDAGTRNLDDTIFNAEPGSLRETGSRTGIFQVVISVPSDIDDDRLERGEEITLQYTDFGPSGADYVGHNTEDIDRIVFTSNFGATIELDQSVYSWTDKVFITITAPDHNLNTNQVDEIGADPYPIRVGTRSDDIKNYKLVETGTNTGIFTGEVILTGFSYDADGDPNTGDDGKDVTGRTCNTCDGPTDGLLPTNNDDGLEVSFEFSDKELVRKSALIRWNIGEVQWLEASYPATATGVLRVIDPDMNLNPESADNFEVKVWSSSAPSGITLTVTETQPASGIFEGTVYFGLSVNSGGHKLSTEEGDTVTARYDDNTLPSPYGRGDSEEITATTIIGTIVPPLERVNIESLRIADSTGTTLSTVSVDQQVQITTDITNKQDKDQPFAYLVQIQDTDGVTVSLSWIAGSLSSKQSQSPSQSWTPTASGEYTITVFAWESLTTPTALSPQQTTTVTVN